jgi:hypothetical protein
VRLFFRLFLAADPRPAHLAQPRFGPTRIALEQDALWDVDAAAQPIRLRTVDAKRHNRLSPMAHRLCLDWKHLADRPEERVCSAKEGIKLF